MGQIKNRDMAIIYYIDEALNLKITNSLKINKFYIFMLQHGNQIVF